MLRRKKWRTFVLTNVDACGAFDDDAFRPEKVEWKSGDEWTKEQRMAAAQQYADRAFDAAVAQIRVGNLLLWNPGFLCGGGYDVEVRLGDVARDGHRHATGFLRCPSGRLRVTSWGEVLGRIGGDEPDGDVCEIPAGNYDYVLVQRCHPDTDPEEPDDSGPADFVLGLTLAAKQRTNEAKRAVRGGAPGLWADEPLC